MVNFRFNDLSCSTIRNSSENKLLSHDDFKQVMLNAPLFAIDLVVVNHNNEVLVGERLNAPAIGCWFVPGGRVYKNETLSDAFGRISVVEIGGYLDINQGQSPGLYEYFYNDSAFSNDVSTHYINVPYLVSARKDMHAPNVQHSSYLWIPFDKIEENPTIHKYSKVFMGTLGLIFKKLALEIGLFDVNYFPSADYKFFGEYVLRNKSNIVLEDNLCLYRVLENESLNEKTWRLFISQLPEIIEYFGSNYLKSSLLKTLFKCYTFFLNKFQLVRIPYAMNSGREGVAKLYDFIVTSFYKIIVVFIVLSIHTVRFFYSLVRVKIFK